MTILEERFADVAGVRLRYLTGGQGRPLVLCHGFLSSAEEFGGRFESLADQRTLIVPDLPGSGASAPLPGRHTAAALAKSVDGLLSQLDVGCFDLGGLCLGASVACALAGLRGDAVKRLVLHTPLVAPSLVNPRYRYQVRVLTQPGIWQGVVWLSRRRMISDLYKRYVIREGPIDRSTSDINFQNQQRATPRAAKEWICDSLSRDDLPLVMERCEPTLVIIARNDHLVDVARLQSLVGELPRGAIYIDEDAGHGWSESAVQRHLAVLQSFFAE